MKKETTQYFCDVKECREEMTMEESIGIEIRYKFNTDWVDDCMVGNPTKKISKHICKRCAKKLGIAKQVVKNNEGIPEVTSTADQLYDLLSQIVWENTANN